MSRQIRVYLYSLAAVNKSIFFHLVKFIYLDKFTHGTSSGPVFTNVVGTAPPQRTFRGGPKSYCTVTNKYYYITARRIRRKLNVPRSNFYYCSSPPPPPIKLRRLLRDALIKLGTFVSLLQFSFKSVFSRLKH
jgi:hypothetical protein